MCGVYRDNKRNNDSFQEGHLLVIDLDRAIAGVDDIVAMLRGYGLACSWFTTWSHGSADKPGTCMRLVFPWQRAVTPEEHDAGHLWAHEWFDSHDVHIVGQKDVCAVDTACADRARLTFLPRGQNPASNVAPRVGRVEGQWLNPDALPLPKHDLRGWLSVSNYLDIQEFEVHDVTVSDNPAPCTNLTRRERGERMCGDEAFSRRVHVAFEGLKQDLAMAGRGQRKRTFNACLYRWGRIIAGNPGEVADELEALQELVNASLAMVPGTDARSRQIRRQIKREYAKSYQAGKAKPDAFPFRELKLGRAAA